MNQKTEYQEYPKGRPDEQILLLSEAFQKTDERQYIDGCLECQARMLNINYGRNRKLMEKCRRLEEYAIFVTRVRQYTAEDMENSREAITRAVDECIEEGILADILSSQKSEVLELVLTTFNRELYEQGFKEDAVKEAIAEAEKKTAVEVKKAEERGEKHGITIGEMKKTIEIYQEFGKSKEEIAAKLIEEFQIPIEEADKAIRLYWKV